MIRSQGKRRHDIRHRRDVIGPQTVTIPHRQRQRPGAFEAGTIQQPISCPRLMQIWHEGVESGSVIDFTERLGSVVQYNGARNAIHIGVGHRQQRRIGWPMLEVFNSTETTGSDK